MQKTHSKSCVLDSAAYITGIPVGILAYYLGDNGEEDGTPMQALIHVLSEGFGLSVMPIDREPYAENPITHVVKKVQFKQFPGLFDTHTGEELPNLSHNDRWDRALLGNRGILIGYRNGRTVPHATAWDEDHIVDPAGGDGTDFEPIRFWRISKVDYSH